MVVLSVFLVLWGLAIYSAESIELGLDQAEAMPSGSYMLDYFEDQSSYLMTGPPVYYIVENGFKRNPAFNYSDPLVQRMFCQNNVNTCSPTSLPNYFSALQQKSEITRVAPGQVFSWMDDLTAFGSPTTDCCFIDASNGSFLPANLNDASYSAKRSSQPHCVSSNDPIPSSQFMNLFNVFSYALPGQNCPYSGAAVYFGQFEVNDKPLPSFKSTDPPPSMQADVGGKQITGASYMTLSLPTQAQQDFIETIRQSYRICDYISEATGVDVWSYSVIFPFFEQYLTLWNTLFLLLGVVLLMIFLMQALYMLAIWVPLLNVLTILGIVICMMGVMPLFGIMLNGLSVVNLVVCAGISVEFTSHVSRAFVSAYGNGDVRMQAALRQVMLSVIFGITVTKIIGVSVLSFAESRIFYRYYFIMYMWVILIGALHGLLFFPVLLSVFGDLEERLRKKQPKPSLEEEVIQSPPVTPDEVKADSS